MKTRVDWHPAALDDLSTGKRENLPGGVHLYQVDLRDRDATLQALADYKPNVVSHQAAQASVSISVRSLLGTCAGSSAWMSCM